MLRSSAASPRLRAAFIAAMLLVALLVAIILALQAMIASRYHQSTAEGVLRDYARLAAGQYAGRASQELFYSNINPVVQLLERMPPGRLPAPALLSRRADEVGRKALEQVAGFVQVSRDGQVELSGADSLVDWSGWLRDTVRSDMRGLERASAFAGIVREEDGRGVLLVYLPVADSNRPVRGFFLPLRSLRSTLGEAATRGPLLPPSLTDGIRRDSLVSVRVTSPSGTTLFQSDPTFPPTFAAWDSMGDYVGRFPVFAALEPNMAGSLIIGGLPRSRVPLLLGLLALTVTLIVAALLLLRREQELGRLRADFVSGVSHELRTPLAQIRMFAETLRLGRVRNEDERQRSLTIVDQEARRLTHLVENLLYFSRSERQAPRITLQSGHLPSLIREVTESFTPLARARSMSIKTEAPLEMTAMIDADAVRQILLNLLDNAVKYGPDGQTITVRLGARAGLALLAVEDEGPGVPERDRNRVWERFWRLERDRHSNIAGTGIGLSIVHELAELHGGSVAVEQAATGGARFVVLLGRLTPSEHGS